MRNLRCITCVIAMVLAVGIAAACAEEDSAMTQQKSYSGISPSDENGRNGLPNPERGFRWENRIGSFDPAWEDQKWLNSIAGRAEDGVTMTQAYCELLDYCQMDRIPEEQIDRLEESFAACRKHGIKLLLCFRYEMNVRDNKGPTTEIILSHIEQLKPVLLANMDVIGILQAGFVGLYGEWHRSHHKLDKDPDAQERILSALLDVLPADRKMVIRYPRHKNSFVKRVSHRGDYQPITSEEAHTQRPEARIGFADHGFMVGANDAGTFGPRPSRDYDYMTQESLFLPMDGEFFWAFSKPYGVKKDDGLEAIRRLWEHHYTLFSYAHNHSRYEGWGWKEKFNARYSLDEWKEEAIAPEWLAENNLPISDRYFEGADGERVERTIFEYIRDHLGYRLELRSSVYPRSIRPGQPLAVAAALVNRGFAAPVNPRPVYLVVIGEGGVHVAAEAETDVRQWYPCVPDDRSVLAPPHTLQFKTQEFPQVTPGAYQLGIWMPDNRESLRKDSRYSVRFANGDVLWWTDSAKNLYGVNVIGSMVVE